MNKAPFAVGDIVTSSYYRDEASVVRVVTTATKDKDCMSGWRISADAGDKCPTCKRLLGTKIPGVDSEWFVFVREATK